MNQEPTPTPSPARRHCPRCGMILPDDALFCGDCGISLETGLTAPLASETPALDTEPLSVGDYLMMRILSMLPVIGVLLLLVWAFSSVGSLHRRNFSRAELILTVAGHLLFLFFLIVASRYF